MKTVPVWLGSHLAQKRGIEPVSVLVLKLIGGDLYLTDRSLPRVYALPTHHALVSAWPEIAPPEPCQVPDGRLTLLNLPGSYGPLGRLSTLFRADAPEDRGVELWQGTAGGTWPEDFDLCFKGRVDEVSRQTEASIQVELVGEAAWVYEQTVGRQATREEFAGLRPEHEGLPIWQVAGTVDRLPLTPIDIGGAGRLATAMTSAQDENGNPITPGPAAIEVSNDQNAADFPAGVHTVQVGSEQLRVSRAGSLFTVVTRGYAGTSVQDHTVGDPVWEVRSAYDYAVCGHVADSVVEVRADNLLQFGGNYTVLPGDPTVVRFAEKPRTVKNLKPGLENSLVVVDTIGVDDQIGILDGVTVNDGLVITDGIGITDGITVVDGIAVIDGITVVDSIDVSDGITIGTTSHSASASTDAMKVADFPVTTPLPFTLSATSVAGQTLVHQHQQLDWTGNTRAGSPADYSFAVQVSPPYVTPSSIGVGGYIRVYLKEGSHSAGNSGGILIYEMYYDGTTLWRDEPGSAGTLISLGYTPGYLCVEVKMAEAGARTDVRVSQLTRKAYPMGVTSVSVSGGTAYRGGSVTSTGSVTRTGEVTRSGGVTRTGSVTRTGEVFRTGGVTKVGEVAKSGTVSKTGGVSVTGDVLLIGGTELLEPAELLTATVTRGTGELTAGLAALATALGVTVGDLTAAQAARAGYRFDYALAGERFGEVLARLSAQSHCRAHVSLEGVLELAPVELTPGTLRRTFTANEILGPVILTRTRRDELAHRLRAWYRRDYRTGWATLAYRAPRAAWADDPAGYLASRSDTAAGGDREGEDARLDLVRDDATAAWWLARSLEEQSRVWERVEWDAALDAYALEPGDTVRLTWPGAHFTTLGAADAELERVGRHPGSGRDQRLDRVRLRARILSDHT